MTKASQISFGSIRTLGWKPAGPERINHEKIVAVAGTKIICPCCKAVIGVISIPLYSGMRIPADAIEFTVGQKRHQHQKAECQRCGEPYLKHRFTPSGLKTFVATEIGWV